MSKRVHTILCWILALSLVWLPLSVSAGFSLQSPEKNHCQKMDSTMPGHKMGSTMAGHKMDSTMPDHKMASGMIEHVANDSIMNKSMRLKKCCGHCKNDCANCTAMSSCIHNSNNSSVFIISNQYFSQIFILAQSSIEQFIQYHNQIITPDIRPPVV